MNDDGGKWLLVFFQLVLAVVLLAGYVQCIVKLNDCDFKQPVKAEIVYGIGAATGLGGITGWIDIEDGEVTE